MVYRVHINWIGGKVVKHRVQILLTDTEREIFDEMKQDAGIDKDSVLAKKAWVAEARRLGYYHKKKRRKKEDDVD